MAQPHLESGEIASLAPLGARLAQTASQALLKSRQLEVMRLVLPAGKLFADHTVAGEITVQCLEGVVDFSAAGATQRMHAGDFLHLDGGVTHALRALEDASVLVTICLVDPAAV